MWRAVLLLVMSPLVVDAQDTSPSVGMDEAGRAAFIAGQEAYARGEFEDALRAFVGGYELSERPQFLFNIANCHERLHQLDEALDFYTRYLDAVPEAANRADVERRMARIRTVQSNEEPAPSTSPEPSRAPAFAAFAVGGAGVVTFAIAGPLALSSHNELANCRPTSSCDGDARDQGKRRALVADIGLGTALVGGVVGVILWFVTNPDTERRAAVDVQPHVSQHEAGLRVGGRF